MTLVGFLAKYLALIFLTMLVRHGAEEAVELNYRLMLLTKKERDEKFLQIETAFNYIVPLLSFVAIGI